jgi:hypothetical protein
MGIDCDAVNVHAQRPLDIALQWGHVNVADVIRHHGGSSLFEDKILQVERHLMMLEDELTNARKELNIERRKREIMQKERDVARRVARLSHTEWKHELMDKMLARGSSKFLETTLKASEQQNRTLTNKYQNAIVWGSYESNWRKRLQEELRIERQRIQERDRCIRMGTEEIRAMKVERKIATEVRDHALAEARASKEARIVAETICKEAIKYMEQLRPYKTKYNQLLRRNGINGVTSSLSDLLRVVPDEVLAGAVKVLSDLSRVTSTAQPDGTVAATTTTTSTAIENTPLIEDGTTNTPMKQDSTVNNTAMMQTIAPQLTLQDLQEVQASRQNTARSTTSSTMSSFSTATATTLKRKKSKKKKKKKRKAAVEDQSTKDSSNNIAFFSRMKQKGVREESNSQLASDLRRSKGESNRMGGLPSTPFDLLILDPYGVGLEVLQCVHMSKDYEGYDRLRVTFRSPVDPNTDYFARVDERRKMDHDAKIAVRRAKDQHRRTAKKIKSLNRLRDSNPSGNSRAAWNSRPNTVEGNLRKMESVLGGLPRREKVYEVEELWQAAFAPNQQRGSHGRKRGVSSSSSSSSSNSGSGGRFEVKEVHGVDDDQGVPRSRHSHSAGVLTPPLPKVRSYKM